VSKNVGVYLLGVIRQLITMTGTNRCVKTALIWHQWNPSIQHH